jgi:hypothetical protein
MIPLARTVILLGWALWGWGSEGRSRNGHLVYPIMATWQMQSPVCGRSVMGVTAFGRSSLSSFSLFTGPPLSLLGRRRSWVVRSEAIPNFALTQF